MRFRRSHRYLAGAPVLAVAVAVTLSLGAWPAQAASLPLQSEASAFLNSTLVWNCNAAPPGANSFGAVSLDLVNNGYCGYAFNYGQTLPLTGFYAMGDIRSSAAQLVGWSQGGV